MKSEYTFHSICYDKELLRKEIIVLNVNHIDFNLVEKENRSPARAPLSGFFETEIYISKADYEKADYLLKEVIERFS